MQPTIKPFLWFDTEAEAAANFYVSVFPDSRIVSVSHYTDAGPREAGMVMVVEFELGGQRFLALNGGSNLHFDDAISFLIACETQEEIDYYWERLTEGGQPGPCGWLKDRFGLSWQVAPARLSEIYDDANPEGSARAMNVMRQMGKLDIAAMRAAAEGVPASG